MLQMSFVFSFVGCLNVCLNVDRWAAAAGGQRRRHQRPVCMPAGSRDVGRRGVREHRSTRRRCRLPQVRPVTTFKLLSYSCAGIAVRFACHHA